MLQKKPHIRINFFVVILYCVISVVSLCKMCNFQCVNVVKPFFPLTACEISNRANLWVQIRVGIKIPRIPGTQGPDSDPLCPPWMDVHSMDLDIQQSIPYPNDSMSNEKSVCSSQNNIFICHFVCQNFPAMNQPLFAEISIISHSMNLRRCVGCCRMHIKGCQICKLNVYFLPPAYQPLQIISFMFSACFSSSNWRLQCHVEMVSGTSIYSRVYVL